MKVEEYFSKLYENFTMEAGSRISFLTATRVNTLLLLSLKSYNHFLKKEKRWVVPFSKERIDGISNFEILLSLSKIIREIKKSSFVVCLCAEGILSFPFVSSFLPVIAKLDEVNTLLRSVPLVPLFAHLPPRSEKLISPGGIIISSPDLKNLFPKEETVSSLSEILNGEMLIDRVVEFYKEFFNPESVIAFYSSLPLPEAKTLFLSKIFTLLE